MTANTITPTVDASLLETPLFGRGAEARPRSILARTSALGFAGFGAGRTGTSQVGAGLAGAFPGGALPVEAGAGSIPVGSEVGEAAPGSHLGGDLLEGRLSGERWVAGLLGPIRRLGARLGAESGLLLSSSTVTLGTDTVPFESLPNARQCLGQLEETTGRTLVLRCRSAAVLEELSRLRRLDQDHVVRIELRVAVSQYGERNRALETACQLAGAGLDVSLILEPGAACASTESSDIGPSGAEESALRADSYLVRFFARAQQAGVADVRLGPAAGSEGVDIRAWARRVEVLRLEYGFPNAGPGRG